MDSTISFYEELFKKRSTHIKYNLSRIQNAANLLDFAALKTPCVLIGGTNGKGSCAAFLWTMLSEFNLKVGLFTSPHMFCFEERFQISNSSSKVTSEHIFEAYVSIQNELNRMSFTQLDELSFFEWSMLIALKIFSDFKVDFVVWEVGMGGRLDATNITNPLVSIVTSIGMDHTEFLGSTIEAITMEKLGICRKNRSLVFGKSSIQEHNELSYSVANKFCRSGGVKDIYFFEKDFNVDEKNLNYFLSQNVDSGSSPIISSRFPLPNSVRNRGEFLVQSLAVAIQSLILVHAISKFFQTEEEFHQKIATTLKKFDAEFELNRPLWPTSVIGRFQKMMVSKSLFYVDVAHNLDGIRAISNRIDASWIVCVSILKDKNFVSMIEVLKSRTQNILLFACDHERSWTKSDIKEAFPNESFRFYDDISFLWQQNKELLLNLSANKKNVLFCGSVLVMAKVIEFFNAKPVSQRWDEVLIAKFLG